MGQISVAFPKTTDDCYTPPNIYEAVVDWCEKEYSIDRTKIVRPFYPGGDYEHYPYKEDSVVIDNPPFSILSKIVRFYNENNIKYFLFAPTLTLFSSNSIRTGIAVRICRLRKWSKSKHLIYHKSKWRRSLSFCSRVV